MRPRSLVPAVLAPAAALLVLAAAACGEPAEHEPAEPSALPPGVVDGRDARSDLAARAALALDKSYAALYTLDDDGSGRQHHVVATIGADGTWRVDVSGGAHGGATDVSIVSIKSGVYQCTVATATNPITPTCVRVAAAGKRVPKAYDPQVERLFRQWLSVFTDRQAPIAVTEVEPLQGAQGRCYSIDSISASLRAPVDVGIYCYADDGVLTAARVGFGVLTIVSQAAGPATVALPGPDVGGRPMPTEAPPPPPSAEPTASAPPA